MDCTRLEKLGGSVTAVISDEHSFGTDAIMLASFASPKKSDAACDLGSGCGIIPLLWCRDGQCREITAFEIQPEACAQIEKAVTLNSLECKLKVVCGDLRQTDSLPGQFSFDLVTMNPPYKATGAGLTSRQDAALIARHETMCSFGDIARAAARLLRFGGRFCVCHRPERLADVMCEMRCAGIEPKRLKTVVHKSGTKANLVLVEGKKGGKSGMIIEPELVLKGENGEYTPEALAAYGLYKN